jgi:hypothetical protein
MSEPSAHQTGSLHCDEAICAADAPGDWPGGDATAGDRDPLQDAASKKMAAAAVMRIHLERMLRISVSQPP